MKQPFKKKYFKLLTLIISLYGIQSVTALPIPKTITNYTSYIKQRTLFTKVFFRALWNFGCKNNPQTIIEQKLEKLYKSVTYSTYKEQVKDLQRALENNPYYCSLSHNFLLGASSSAYQNEGGLDETSAAARYYLSQGLPVAGDTIDFFHHYKEIITEMKQQLHINAYRISIAWNRIEPMQGNYDFNAILFYKNVIQYMLEQGIKPMIVFHHYDVPTWFEDLGGFELEENGKLFQQFCLYVYKHLAKELGECLISMCNAPEGSAFKGYFNGDGTPGQKNMHKTHTVIANMYYELVDTALAIKNMYQKLVIIDPSIKKPFIGTQINILPFDPHPSMNLNWQDRLKSTIGCEIASYIQSGGTYKFLVTGEYRMFTPNANFMKQAKDVNVYRYHAQAHKAFDWIGVNIYSNNFLKGFDRINGKNLIEEDDERYTDNTNYRNYPEGIYRAVKMISDNVAVPLGKLNNKNGKPLPIIITENGIATKDDAKRNRYFQRALCTITELIKDGYYVIGYLPWGSHDNYEWPTQETPDAFGTKCYGFFAVNFDKNSPDYLKRTLKPGARYYADFAQEFFKTI